MKNSVETYIVKETQIKKRNRLKLLKLMLSMFLTRPQPSAVKPWMTFELLMVCSSKSETTECTDVEYGFWQKEKFRRVVMKPYCSASASKS